MKKKLNVDLKSFASPFNYTDNNLKKKPLANSVGLYSTDLIKNQTLGLIMIMYQFI